LRLKNLIIKNENKPSKDIRYKINEEHYLFKGENNMSLYFFRGVNLDEKNKERVGNQWKIDRYITTWLDETFDYQPSSTDEIVKLIETTNKVLDKSTSVMFGKNTGVYNFPVEEAPKNSDIKTKKEITASLKERGFNDDEIAYIFKVGTNAPNKQIIYLTDEELKGERSLEKSKRKLKKGNDAIAEIIFNTINRKKYYKVINQKELSEEEIVELNTIGIYNNHKDFMKFVANHFRGAKDKFADLDITNVPIENIYKTFSFLGIKENTINNLLKYNYNNLNHFLNKFVKDVTGTKDSKLKVAFMMMYINYLKKEFMNYSKTNTALDIQEKIREEKNTDVQNTLNYRELNIQGLFSRSGSLTNDPITFSLNNGFDIYKSAQDRTNLINNRLEKIILPDNTVIDAEYDGTKRHIYYKQNNAIKLASRLQNTFYDYIFLSDDGGYVGNRSRDMMNLRSEFTNDMIIESYAQHYNDVGSPSPLYFNTRKNFSEVLKLVKVDYLDFQFIRVRDVSTAIGFFNSNKDAKGFYLDYFNNKFENAKQAYINKNMQPGKNVDDLAKEFDNSVKAAIAEVTKVFTGTNNVVGLDRTEVEAIIGFIMVSRFEEPEFYNNLDENYKAYVTETLVETSNNIKIKRQYITNRIKEVLFDNALTDSEKKKALAVIEGKNKFSELTEEAQSNINEAIRRQKLITNGYLNNDRWYDTLAVARGPKTLEGSKTDAVGTLKITKKQLLKTKKDELRKIKAGITRNENNILDREKQKKLFGINDVYNYPNTNDEQVLMSRADTTIDSLQKIVTTEQTALVLEERRFKDEKIKLLNELFKLYPGLYTKYFEGLIKRESIELDKILENLKTLNKKTNKVITEAYNRYLTIIEEIKKEQNKITYKVFGVILNRSVAGTINSIKEEDLPTLFDLFEVELKKVVGANAAGKVVVGINTVEDLKAALNEAKKDNVFDVLKTLYNERDKVGSDLKSGTRKIAKKTFDNYVIDRETLEEKKNEQEKYISELRLDIDDRKGFLTYEEKLEFLEKILKEYNETYKSEQTELFKDLKDGKPVAQLDDKQKAKILEDYQKLYNQRFSFLVEAYKNLRFFNNLMGLTIPEIDIDGTISTTNNKKDKVYKYGMSSDRLLKALSNEIEHLKSQIETYRNKVVNVPAALEINEVEGRVDFKVNLYIDLIVKITVDRLEKTRNKKISDVQIDIIRKDIINQLTDDGDLSKLTSKDIKIFSTYLYRLVEYKEHYQPSKNNYGVNDHVLDLTKYVDPIEQRYVIELLSIVNNKRATTYNDVIKTTVKNVNKQIETTSSNIKSFETADAILDRNQNKVALPNKKTTANVFKSVFANGVQANVIHGSTNLDDLTVNKLITLLKTTKTNSQITAIKNRIAEKQKQIENVQEYKKLRENIDIKKQLRLELETNIKALEEEIKKIESDYKKAATDENKVVGENLKNITLFKTYYGYQDIEDDQEILNKVIELVKKNYPKWAVNNKIETFIKDRGDFAIHNGLVDALITHFNYIHQVKNSKMTDQEKTAAFEHVVVDIETYKVGNTNKPYQITIIYQDKNGELSIDNVYISSPVFFDFIKNNETGELEFGETLTQFFQQQKSIWKEQWKKEKLTDAAFEKRATTKMYELVNRIQKIKNESVFVEALLRLVRPGNSFKVVAHNGFNFDFDILTNFIRSVGENIVINNYYRTKQKSEDINVLEENIRKSSATTADADQKTIDALNKLFFKNLKELEEEELKPERDQTSIQILNDAMDAILNRLKNLSIKVVVNNGAFNRKFILNDELRAKLFDAETGVIKEVEDLVIKYLNSAKDSKLRIELKDKLVIRFLARIDPNAEDEQKVNTVVDYVETFLKSVEEEFKDLLNGNKVISYNLGNNTTIKKQIISNVTKLAETKFGLSINENKDGLIINVSLERARRNAQIENLKSLLRLVEKAGSVKDAKKGIVAEKDKLKLEKENLEKQIAEKRKNITPFNREVVLTEILKNAKKIFNLQQQFAARTNTALEQIKNLTYNYNLSVSYTNALEIQKTINNRDIANMLNALTNLLKYVKNGEELDNKDVIAKLGLYVDERILRVLINPEEKEAIKAEIAKELSSYDFKTNTRNEVTQKIIDQEFKKIIERHTVLLKDLLSDFITKNLIELRKIKGLEKIDFKTVEDIQALKKVLDNQALAEKNPIVYQSIVALNKMLNVGAILKFKTSEEILNNSKYRNLMNLSIEKYLEGLENANAFLNDYNGDSKLILTNLFSEVYNALMSTYNNNEKLDTILHQSMFSAIRGVKVGSDMDDDEYRKASSTLKNQEELQKQSSLLKKLNVWSFYEDPDEFNPVSVMRLLPEKIYGKLINNTINKEEEESDSDEVELDKNGYSFTTVDDLHNEASTVKYYANANQLVFTFKYAYTTKDLQYSGGGERGYETAIKVMRIDLNEEGLNKLNTFRKNFYWNQKISKNEDAYIIAGVTKEQLFFYPNKKNIVDDFSKKSIDSLIDFVVKNFDKFKNGKVESVYKNDKDVLRHEEFSLSDKYVEIYSLEDVINRLVLNQINLLNAVDRTPRKIKEIYSGIYNTVTARYKALDPKSIVNQINPEYTYDYNVKNIDKAFVKQHNILISASSEGSALSSLKVKPRFSGVFPFALSTNSIRTMLSHQHIYAKYTTIGAMNEVYKDVIQKHGLEAPGKYLLNTFIDGNYMSKNKFDKEVKDRLIRRADLTGGRKASQLFMPNVMSKELHDEYKNDSTVHQFGYSLPVSFVKDPRIPLDVIAIDEDFYNASGWGEGNKTWVGLHYGFKGGVKVIPGLYKLYGSYIAADANSVKSRGAQGAYAEMMFNYIRGYLLNETTDEGKSVVPDQLIKYYDAIKDTLNSKFKNLIDLNDGVMDLNYLRVQEYFKVINEALSKLPEFKDQDKKYLYMNLIKLKFTGNKDYSGSTPNKLTVPAYVEKKESTYATLEDGSVERKFINVNFEKGEYARGYMYVFADNEHSAQAMHTQTQFNKVGNIVLNITDANNNVPVGLNISPTLFYPMIPKIGYDNFLKVFPPDDTTMKLLLEPRALGLKGYIKKVLAKENIEFKEENVGTTLNVTSIVKLLTVLKNNRKIDTKVADKLITYVDLVERFNKSQTDKDNINKQIEKLISETTESILKRMYDGTNGAYFRMNFKRWDGIRQQFLADYSLKQGQIAVSQQGWEAIKAKDSNGSLIKKEAVPLDELKEYDLEVNSYRNINNKINYLNSRGITELLNPEIHEKVKQGTAIILANEKNVTREYAYVMAARSPVQDYGAVPVFKVIGYTNSYAALVNVYAYKMMGADNDGDTFGMALLKHADVENGGPLAALDSTKEEYYSFDESTEADKGNDTVIHNYVPEQLSEMFGKNKATGRPDINLNTLEHTVGKIEDLNYSYLQQFSGKNTFDVRDDKTYFNMELLYQLDKEAFNKLAADAEESLNEFNTSSNDDLLKLRVITNAYIRMFNKGKDYIDTFKKGSYGKIKNGILTNVENLIAFYNKVENKRMIDILYTIENNFNKNKYVYGKDIVLSKEIVEKYLDLFTPTEQTIIKTSSHRDHAQYMEYVYLAAIEELSTFNTAIRVRVSKNGVNYGGNKRKDVMVASHVSNYKRINLSKKGHFWKAIGAADNKGQVTVKSLISALFGIEQTTSEEEFFKWIGKHEGRFVSKESLLQFIKEEDGNKLIININRKGSALHYYASDIPDLLDDVVKLIKKYFTASKELGELKALTGKDKVSREDLINFIENSSKKNDVVLSTYLQLLKENKDIVVNESYVNEIAMQYINNASVFKKFKQKFIVEELAQGYLKQYIIERVALNNLSDAMTRIIAVAKHFGIDTDPVEFYETYIKEMNELTVDLGLRNVSVGTDGPDHRIGMSINVDRHGYKRFELRSKENVNNRTLNSEYYKTNSPTELKEAYSTKEEAAYTINGRIDDRAKMILFGNMYIPTELINEIYDKLKVLNANLVKYSELDFNVKELEEPIAFFNRLGIPLYKLIRLLKDGVSISLYVKGIFEAQNPGSILKLETVKVKPSMFKNVYNLVALLKDAEFKETFKNTFKNELVVYNFFNNVNELDETMYRYDLATGSMRSVDNVEDFELDQLTFLEGFAEGRSSLNTQSGVENNISPELLEQATVDTANKKVQQQVEVNYGSTAITYNESIDRLNKELILLFKLKETIDETKASLGRSDFKQQFQTVLQEKLKDEEAAKYFKYARIAKFARNITDYYNAYLNNEAAIEKFEKEVLIINRKIKDIESTIENLENQEEALKGKDTLVSRIKDLIKAEEKKDVELQERAVKFAVSNNIKGGLLFLTDDNGNGIGDGTVSKPRYLTQSDIVKAKNESLIDLTSNISYLIDIVDPNNEQLSFKYLAEMLTRDSINYRIVMISPPDTDETGYKNILSNIRKYDPKVDDVLYGSTTEDLYFKSIAELVKWQQDGNKVVFNNKVYTKIDPSLIIRDANGKDNLNITNINQTIKYFDIKNANDVRELYEFAKTSGAIIGIVDTDVWMRTLERTYNAYKRPTKVDNWIQKLQFQSKNLQKASLGFHVRNAADTIFQLFSNYYILPKFADSKTFLRLVVTGSQIYSLYKKLSEEHTLTILNVGVHYEDLVKLIGKANVDPAIIKNKIDLIKEVLENYVNVGKTVQNNTRITYRLRTALSILDNLIKVTEVNVKDNLGLLKNVVTFVSNIQFGEWVDLYENREVNGKWIPGLRMDALDNTGAVRVSSLKKNPSFEQRYGAEEWKWRRTLLKEFSAFFNTSAISDYLRKDRFEKLPGFFESYRGYEDKPEEEFTYEELKTRYKTISKELTDGEFRRDYGLIGGGIAKAFQGATNWTENMARIVNFFINIEIHNKSFDSAKLDSLRRWFSYGQRSPLEKTLMTDIPFISFPVRSIQNWIDRLNNPKFWRLMSDFIDGWYGQYLDEETKEYDDFMQYQIRAGWLPLSKNVGIRIGNGAFDVMNIIYGLDQTLEGRQSPILRATRTLVETGDPFKAVRAFASIGLFSRLVNGITGISDSIFGTQLRQGIAQTPGLNQVLSGKPASLGTIAPTLFYDINSYEKYTPRRYRYGNNGRWAKYENIYRDWFNKFGRMRRPTTDPYRLVKNIQWRQYVRYRQSKAIIGR